MPSHTVCFGPFQLDLRAAELSHNGHKSKLPEQPFQVLTALVECPREVVTREELRQRLWPSGTFVDFEHGLNTAVKRLREALGDSAESPRYIETLPHHGYRLMIPVEKLEVAPSAPPTRAGGPVGKWKLRLAISVFVIAATAGLVWRARWLDRSRSVKVEAVAVLPLENLSGDPREEHFTDSLTEELITELGKIHSLRVISHHSVMQYKGTSKTISQIARELQVDALVEGSAMRNDGQVRITIQLLQADPEGHLWSETYERSESDVIVLQREIAQEVIRQIKPTLLPHEKDPTHY